MSRSRPLVLPLLALLTAACSSSAPTPAPEQAVANEKTDAAQTQTQTEAAAAAAPDEQVQAEPPPTSETPPPPPAAPPPPPSFADLVAPLVAGATPTADSGKTGWTHYKAKAYADAQKHFALAALHEPGEWKPAFNLACASALAGDEAMVRIALTEAVARDGEVVPDKARKDGDLEPFRSKPWFEEVLAGPPAAFPDSPADADADGELEEGMMYFVLSDGGVVYLDDLGTFVGPSKGGQRLEVSPDGIEYVVDNDGSNFFVRLNYDGSERNVIDKQAGSVWDFDARPGGELWVAGSKGVGHFTPATGSWKVYPTTDSVTAGTTNIVGIRADETGKPWVANPSGVFALEGDRFVAASLPGPASKHIELLRGADGGLYLHRSGDVLQLSGGAWVAAKAPTPPAGGSLQAVAVLADGSIVAFTSPDGQLVRVSKTGVTATLRLDDETSVYALAVDTSGRVWASTAIGLFVTSPDFTRIFRRYGVGSIEEFKSSPGGSLKQIVSVGKPMDLPDSQKPQHVAAGRLMYAGKPLANTRFDMCGDPARKRSQMGSKGTPCDMEDDATGGKTDAEGRFRVTGLYGGAYDFAAFVGDGKIGATDSYPCCEHMPDEGIYQMGDVTLR